MTHDGLPNALEQLRVEHQHILALLRQLEGEFHPRRAAGLYRTMYEDLAAHAAAEQAVLYPALGRVGAADEMLRTASAAHARIAALAEQIANSPPHLSPWRENVRALQRLFAEHVAREEEELFAAAQTGLGGDALRHLGMALRDAELSWRTVGRCEDTSDSPTRRGADSGLAVAAGAAL
jgi:hypothetical protein